MQKSKKCVLTDLTTPRTDHYNPFTFVTVYKNYYNYQFIHKNNASGCVFNIILHNIKHLSSLLMVNAFNIVINLTYFEVVFRIEPIVVVKKYSCHSWLSNEIRNWNYYIMLVRYVMFIGTPIEFVVGKIKANCELNLTV